MKVLLTIILTLIVQGMCYAQLADTVMTELKRVAEFEEAVSVSASPGGRMYVIDLGSSNIHEFSEDGQFARVLGGPGASAGQFDEPMDLDPTNGLILVVADGGNGRIQRFSREFLFLESLPVGGYGTGGASSFSSQPRYRQDEDAELIGSGRPVSVRTTVDNRMYALDASERVIVEWDQDRNMTQLIGEYSEGEGALIDPVAFDLGSDGSLFVLDKGHESVRVYDAFGGYLRSMGVGILSDALSINRITNRMVVGLMDQLLVFHERGLLERRIRVDVEHPIVDVVYVRGVLYVLTSRELLEYTGDAKVILKLEDL